MAHGALVDQPCPADGVLTVIHQGKWCRTLEGAQAVKNRAYSSLHMEPHPVFWYDGERAQAGIGAVEGRP